MAVICLLCVFSGDSQIYGANDGGEKVKDKISAPVAKRVKKELVKFGHSRFDHYYWLNQRENPEVIKYLEAENKYLKESLKHTEGLQEELFKEITGRIVKDDTTVPYKKNGYYYYTRYEKGKEYPIHCRKKGSLRAEEEILLNVNEMAEGHKYFSVRGLSVSPDNTMLAYGVDTVSRRKYTIHFKDLTTGRILDDKIKNTTASSVWANNNRTVFYTKKDKTLRSFKIFRHQLGDDPAGDRLVFHESDPTFSCYVFKSKSDTYIMIGSGSTLTSEYRFLNADKPDGKFSIIHPRERGIEYSVEHFVDRFYIRTNYKAENFRLVSTPVDKTEKENWTELIPHREDVYLSDFDIFKNFLVLNERKNALNRLRIIGWKDKKEHYLDFGEEAYTVYTTQNYDFDTDILRYGYSSMTTPQSTFDYNMKTKKKNLLKEEKVLGGFDKKNYKTERIFATARDGVKVPVSLVYRTDKFQRGKNPLYVYGYGSYGASMSAGFRSYRLSLIDRGFVYAIAHIRGGQEMGRYWYEDGKLLKKKNTFSDFIDCTEFLIREKYGDRQKVFAMGGSAGGLLTGAIYNMRPDLYRGVISHVPFVDVVTTMLDDSIPLTTSEYDEWGNPNEEKYYRYMLSYSPYDNVEKKAYPAMLVTTGLHDSQVQYWEPAKWVAKLRYLKTDQNPLYLNVNMDAGHGGASGRFRRYKETALEYAFILDLLGMKD